MVIKMKSEKEIRAMLNAQVCFHQQDIELDWREGELESKGQIKALKWVLNKNGEQK